MGDQYGLTVWMELKVKNLNEVEKKVKEKLKGMDVGLDKAKVMKGAMKGAKGGPLGALTGGLGGAGMATAAAGVGAVAAGLFATYSILKKIHNRIDKMASKFESSNAEFKGARELMEKMWNQALRPIGNIMTIMMKPFLALAMRFLKPRLTQMHEILSRTGGQPEGADLEELMDIWKGTAEGLKFIFGDMISSLKPIMAEVDGFSAALDILYNTWLDGIGTWINVFLEKMTEGVQPMPDSLAEFLMDEIEQNKTSITDLPGNLGTKLQFWFAEKKGGFMGAMNYGINSFINAFDYLEREIKRRIDENIRATQSYNIGFAREYYSGAYENDVDAAEAYYSGDLGASQSRGLVVNNTYTINSTGNTPEEIESAARRASRQTEQELKARGGI